MNVLEHKSFGIIVLDKNRYCQCETIIIKTIYYKKKYDLNECTRALKFLNHCTR